MQHEDSLAVVQAWQEAANNQDIDRLLMLSASDIEIVGPRGSGYGHKLLGEWLSRAGLTLKTLRAFARGNIFVVEQHGVWRSVGTGEVTGERDLASRFRVDAGRVVQFARHDSLDEALSEAGLSYSDEVRQQNIGMDNLYISTHPLVQHKLALMRSVSTEPKKFREVVREITTLLLYEATLDFATEEVDIQTPLSMTTCRQLTERVGFVPILRAGVGMVDAALELIPTAQVWHIGLYRDHRTLLPVEYYNKLPVIPTVDVCLVLDPMLATAGSATATVKVLKDWGAKKIKYVGLIAAPEGVQRFHNEHPDVPIHIASVDSHLNENGYIVPGLGDAGDRQFGTS